MGLFSRSRASSRASNAPPPQAPPTSAAAIAALQAAGASQGSTRLAAGAAAAALRSGRTTPVDPADVTTKRMLRRSSISSNTSNTSYQHGGQQLSRRGSIGSMASRTFRSPSPHGQRVPADPNAPPVPDLPRTISPAPSLLTKRTFRRPASTEPPARVVSPTPGKGGRFSSVDTRRKPAAIRTSLDDIAENKNGNRNSINFSRPMSPDNRPLSPALDSPTSPTMRIKRQSGPPASPLSRGEAQQLEYEYQRTANEPVHRRKNLAGVEGSHLAAATMGHRPTGTAVDDPPSRAMSPVQRPQRIPLPRRISEEPSDVDDQEFEEIFDPHTRTMIKRRKPGYKPKAQQAPTPARVSSPAIAASPARARLAAANAAAPSPARPVAPTPAKASQPSREASLSPSRAARFSLQPETTPLRHEPSRSVSPRKSALKTSPSPRGPSPAGPPNNRMSWNQPGFSPSEASDNMSQISDTAPKRRSMRVSFDERPTMIGTSNDPQPTIDSPTMMSPQEKKRGLFGFGKKKQTVADASEDGYTPTPALPSFGSVRGKKDGQVIQVSSQQEAEGAYESLMGVALTTGEKTPSEAGSALDPGSEAARDVEDEKSADHVPSIAIDPGTPGLETKLTRSFSAEIIETAEEPSSQVKGSSPAVAGTSESVPPAVAVEHAPKPQAIGHVAAPSVKQTEDTPADAGEESDSSHYSDANEDAAAGEGDGFGSINAIVDSPVLRAKQAAKEASAVKMADALPPLSDEPPKEVSPVAATEAEAGGTDKETTTFREAKVQADGAIVSSATTDASGAEKVTETTEHTTEGAALGPSARVIATSPEKSEDTPDNLKKQIPAVSEATGPQSVSFNPRRADGASDSTTSQDKTEDWTKTQSYWADINARRKAEIDTADESRPLPQSSAYPTFKVSPRQSALIEPEDAPKVVETTTPRKELTSEVQAASRTSTPARSESQKPLKSALKKTASPANPIRNSMPPPNAAAAAALTNTTMPEARGTLSKRNRPMSSAASSAPQPNNQDAAIQLAQAIMKVQNDKKANAPPVEPSHRKSGSYSSLSGQAPPKRSGFVPPMPKLRRKNSSDSDSSFNRARSVTSEGGRVSMRRSMRAGGGGRPQSMAVGGSLRQPPSTTANGRPMSMRMNSGGSASLRQSRQPSPTRSLLGFKKSAKPAGPAARPRASRFAADSDDEDMPTAAYSSRFDDSDEDTVPPLRPVRGIPKKPGRAPSPDLEDSDSDYEIRTSATRPAGTGITTATSATEDDRLMELARQRLGIENRPTVPNAADTEAAHSPVGEDKTFTQGDLVSAFAEKKAAAKEANLSKRRSIFGSLGRKKRDTTKVEKDRDESIARKDTPLERTRMERQNTGTAISSVNSTPQRPTASRLNTQERAKLVKEGTDPDSWPLPESPTVAQRPSTAQDTNGDGYNGATAARPGLGQRHFSADGVPLNRKGNKKRFMGLRRAFGLHD